MSSAIKNNFHDESVPAASLIDSVFEFLNCKDLLTKELIKILIQDIILFDNKQHDYGPRNISDFGELGVLVRVNDKIQRLRHLHNDRKYNSPKNESVEDSWADITVYGAIARMVRNGHWPESSSRKLSSDSSELPTTRSS